MALSAAPTIASSFNPTDEELILRFLSKKANGQLLPDDATNSIHECDLYGEKNPWEIWEAFGGGNRGELYFFSIKKKKASRLVRPIGLGSWEAENEVRAILASKGTRQRIGTKRCLWFDKSGTNHDGAWIMHEYSLHKSLLSNSLYENNYVLCKLIKKEGDHIEQKTGKERTRQEVATGPGTMQSTGLQIAANDASTNDNGGLGDIEERPIRNEKGQLHEEGGDERTKVDESTAATTQHDDEEHDERTNEEPLMQEEKEEEEERIKLIPNPVARDLLLERFEGLTLGGHVASNLKSSSENTAAAANNSTSTSTTEFIGRKHECSTCHKVFPTGQALGGHMRRHFKQHRDFGLNLPAPPAGLEGGD